MKKQLLILSALFISMTVFGQKNEIKSAEKAIKSENFAAAMQAINQAEGLITNADDKTKAKFYYLKGMALYQNGKSPENIKKVGEAFNELLSIEKKMNSFKYTNDVGALLNTIISNTAKKASTSYTSKDYKEAAKGFYKVYALSPRDTSYLDNAALSMYFAEDFETSNKWFKQLLDLGYTGIYTVYEATEKETGTIQSFGSKKEMDLQVKVGLYENPRTTVSDSRVASIIKVMAQNYVALGKTDEALATITEARKMNPNDYNLVIEEANVYFKLGDNVKFKELLEEAVQLNENEPTLHYNIGVINLEQGNRVEAIKSFEKAVELKPDYGDAYNNIGATILEEANDIVEEMNQNLSNFDKYDALQAKQLEVYKKALPYYEKAHKLNKKNISTMQTLLGIYENLEMYDKQKELKALYDASK